MNSNRKNNRRLPAPKQPVQHRQSAATQDPAAPDYRKLLRAADGDKRSALKLFWKEAKLPGRLGAWVQPDPKSSPIPSDVLLIPDTKDKKGRLIPDRDAGPAVELVASLLSQLDKDHLKPLRVHIQSVLLRPAADGKWAVLLQVPPPGEAIWKAVKSFGEFLHRNHPEVIALHAFSSMPTTPYDPSRPPPSARLRLRECYGPTILAAGHPVGCKYQVLDWMPTHRALLDSMPTSLVEHIHPRKGDRLLWLFAGCGPIALPVAAKFEEATLVDARLVAQESIHSVRLPHTVRFEREVVETKYLEDFFARQKGDGMWTVVLDPPSDAPLSAGVVGAIARQRPARIVHLIDNPSLLISETRRWRRQGYMLRKAVPFDSDPRGNDFSMALFFAPDRDGVMAEGRRRKPVAVDIPEDKPEAPTLRFVQRKPSSPRKRV